VGRALAVRLLLDMHALLLWWWKDDPRLSKRAAAAIQDERNTVLVSAASAWEIASKHRIDKLPSVETALREFNELITADGLIHRAVAHSHAIKAGQSMWSTVIRLIGCWPHRPPSKVRRLSLKTPR